MGAATQQLKALLYKNFLLKRRSPLTTIGMVLLPALVMLLLVWIHHYTTVTHHPSETHTNENLCYLHTKSAVKNLRAEIESQKRVLAFAPHEEFTDVINILTSPLVETPLSKDHMLLFDTVKDFNKYMSSKTYGVESPSVLGALVAPSGAFAGPDYSYTIRMNATSDGKKQGTPNTEATVPFEQTRATYDPASYRTYCHKGFSGLQLVVDTAIMIREGVTSLQAAVSATQPITYPMPTAAYTEDDFAELIGGYIGMFFTIMGVMPVSIVVSELVQEKESRMRESSRMMGLKTWIMTASWAITYLVLFAVACAGITLSTTFSVFKHSDVSVIFLYFFCYYITVFSFAFYMSSYFSKSQTASSISSIAFIAMLVVASFAGTASSSRGSKVFASILPAVALRFGSETIAKLESSTLGATWGTIDRVVEGFSVADGITMFLFTSVLLFVFGLYLQEVLPSEFGVPRSKLFCCYPSFWACCSSSRRRRSRGQGALNSDLGMGLMAAEGVEDETLGTGLTMFDNEPYSRIEAPDAALAGRALVRLRGLRRTFTITAGGESREFIAVKGMSLDMYEGQIFTLLGHNGAGKSTTFNMLTGLYPSSGGTATILGYDIAEDMDEVRRSMGVCPQHDVLYPHLSVREHLELFAAVKGVPKSEIPAAASAMIDDIGLGVSGDNKAHALAGTLSGGQKRKLSVGIALIGNSKVVFLDEPSSGMDVASQRVIWDLLLRYKRDRVIVLTTHSMEEAEIGDRIAIMAAGKLMCNGSSLFLKQQYGAGYTLTVSKVRAAPGCSAASVPVGAQLPSPVPVSPTSSALSPTDEAAVDAAVDAALSRARSEGISPIRALVLALIPTAEVLSDAGGEISFRLPFSAASQFPMLFDALEQRRAALGVAAAGMSVTTLTEVFLRVGHGPTEEELEAEIPDALEQQQHQQQPASPRSGLQQTALTPTPTSSLNANAVAADAEPAVSPLNMPRPPPLKGLSGMVRTVFALCVRRFHAARRDRRMWMWQLVIPGIVLGLNIVATNLATHPAYPAAVISLDSVPTTHVVPIVNATHASGTTPANAVELLADAMHTSFPDMEPQLRNDVELDPFPQLGERFSVALLRDIDPDFKPKPKREASSWAESAEESEEGPATLFDTISTAVGDYAFDLFHDLTGRPRGAKKASKDRFFGLAASSLNNADFSPHAPVSDAAAAAANGDFSASFVMLVNTTSRDGLPIALNTWTNSLLRASHKDDKRNGPAPTVTVVNKPLDKTKGMMALVSSGIGFALAMALSFVPATFAAFVVRERSDKGKHLLLISGVSPSAYWLSSLVWDMINFSLPFLLVMGLLFGLGATAFIGSATMATAVTLQAFALASAPFVYCLSFLFESHSTAQSVVLMINFFCSVMLAIVHVVMSIIPSTKSLNSNLAFLYRLLPPFCLGEYSINAAMRETTITHAKIPDPFSLEVAGWPIIFLLIDFVLFSILLALIEHGSAHGWFSALQSLICSRRTPAAAPSTGTLAGTAQTNGYGLLTDDAVASFATDPEDEDVSAERARIAAGLCDNSDEYVATLKGLRKVYPSRMGREPHVAVASMAYAVSRGECFGFLGGNGAGKTTTLKMLTGDEIPTSGTALLGGMDILQQPYEVRQIIGYCPQFDALLPLLTAREHLTLYARVKGLPEPAVAPFVNALIKELELGGIADKPAGTYSGGNKRRLSVGIALVGNPQVVFLDEPSTGVDPQARRQMWQLISSTMANRSVILTTHSMEECEALCDRIGIMAGGRLRCLGTAPHLKQRFGSGYQVLVKAREGRAEDVLAWVMRSFPSTKVLEAHGTSLKLRVNKAEAGMTSAVFRTFENAKTKVGIDSYSVSDTDLEQIFLQIMHEQGARDAAAEAKRAAGSTAFDDDQEGAASEEATAAVSVAAVGGGQEKGVAAHSHVLLLQ